MASAQAKKKGKVKGKTVNLNDFLAAGSGGGSSAGPGSSYVMGNQATSSWAEQADDTLDTTTAWNDNPDYGKPLPSRTALPTAPRSAQPLEIDRSKLPDKPPYTVYLGNIPFDADEEDISRFLRACSVSQVRLPRETETGRLKGFGYAELDDMESLLTALQLNEQTMRNRRIRVDLASQAQSEGQQGGHGFDRTEEDTDWRRGGGQSSGGDRDRGGFGGRDDRDGGRGFDRTEDDTDWRKGGGQASTFNRDRDDRYGGDRGGGFDRDRRDRGGRGFENYEAPRGRSDYGDRRRDDRGGGFDNYNRDRDGGGGRGFDNYNRDSRDRDGGGRGFDNYNRDSRGGDRYGDRGGDRYGDRGGDRYGDRGGDRYGDRGGDRYGDRGGDRYGDRGGDRGGDRYGDRGGDRGRSYGGGGHDDRDGRGGDRQDGEGRDRDPPRERKKLVLEKRTKPVEQTAPPPPVAAPAKAPAKAPPKSSGGASIFGSAKPVDTASREREIEERLAHKRTEADNERLRDFERKERIDRGSGSSRRESEGDEVRERHRSRHSSTGSQGKAGPRPVMIRRESERSNPDDDAVFKKEDVTSQPKTPTSPKSPLSPKSPKSPTSPRQSTEDQNKVMKPAPPPKENAWAKRSESVGSPPPPQSTSAAHAPSKSPPVRDEGGSKAGGPRTVEKKYVEAPPPQQNAWGKRSTGSTRPADAGRGTSVDRRGPPPRDDRRGPPRDDRRGPRDDRRGPPPKDGRRGPPQGDDRRRDAGGRDTRNQPKTSEHKELPKYEEPKPKDWSAPNKYSMLPADGDDIAGDSD